VTSRQDKCAWCGADRWEHLFVCPSCNKEYISGKKPDTSALGQAKKRWAEKKQLEEIERNDPNYFPTAKHPLGKFTRFILKPKLIFAIYQRFPTLGSLILFCIWLPIAWLPCILAFLSIFLIELLPGYWYFFGWCIWLCVVLAGITTSWYLFNPDD